MKRFLLLFVALAIMITAMPVSATENQAYELWTESPYVTSGITTAELNIQKGLNLNELDLFKLNRIGSNIWLAMAERKMTNGGYNSNQKTSNLYFYTILVNGNDYVVLSESSLSEEYYWDRGLNFRDLSAEVWNTSWYTSKGYEVPYYILQANSMYSSTSNGYGTRYEYIIISNTGKLEKYDASYNYTDTPIAYNGLLYLEQDWYYSSSRYYRYQDALGNYQAKLSPMAISSGGGIAYDAGTMYNLTGTTLNIGQISFTNGNISSNIGATTFYKLSDDLYYTAGSVSRWDGATNSTYYDYQVNVYRTLNNNMNLIAQKTMQTTNTYPQTLTVQSLGELDRTYYVNKSAPIPKHIVYGKIVINEDGSIMSLDPQRISPTIYTSWYYSIYNNRLAIVRDRNGSNSVYEKNPATNYYCYWQMINYVYSISGTMQVEADIKLPIIYAANAGQNGFYYNYNSYTQPTLNTVNYSQPSEWLIKSKGNTFPDGRTVTVRWNGIGNNIYEIWYDIMNPDGTRRATGPTGYSAQFSSGFDTYPLGVMTFNNSKFVAYINQIGHSFIREYYRVAVVEETIGGEVVTGGNVGKKNITPPNTADTIPINTQIDFAENDLPLGYNLNPTLKNDINTIILPDIIIVKKVGYFSGVNNTGQNLDSFSSYDYSFGSSYIRFYTNGSNLQWYCYNPENLTVGTYNKSFVIGTKTIYVKIKIVAPPTNNGTTTVVF